MPLDNFLLLLDEQIIKHLEMTPSSEDDIIIMCQEEILLLVVVKIIRHS